MGGLVPPKDVGSPFLPLLGFRGMVPKVHKLSLGNKTLNTITTTPGDEDIQHVIGWNYTLDSASCKRIKSRLLTLQEENINSGI